MKFSISLIIVFCFKAMNCNVYPVDIYAVKIGDPITCTCRTFSGMELTWILLKENGEKIPLINRCTFPFKNCTFEFLHGGITLKADDVKDRRTVVRTHLTVERAEQEMMALLCSVNIPVQMCLLNFLYNGRDYTGIYSAKIGDPFTCTCRVSRIGELTWKLHKVNGEIYSLITNCPYPFINCSVQYHQGGITLKADEENDRWNSITTHLTIQHAEQDMTGIFCSKDIIQERCLLNFDANVGVIHKLYEGDQFICECRRFDDMDAEWTLELIGGENISFTTDCYSQNNCFHGNDTGYVPRIIKNDKRNGSIIVSTLTLMHVKKDMLRVYCAADDLTSRNLCMMNVVDISEKFTTQSLSQSATGNYTNNHVQSIDVILLVCITVLPISAMIIITTMAFCCCYQKKKLKALQRLNQTMRDNNNTTSLPLATVSRPGQNDQDLTYLNLEFHSMNNTSAITEPPHYTESDLPPTYASLFQSLEHPSHTTLRDNTERYSSVYYSPCQAPNEPPPPYSSSVCLDRNA